VLVSTAKLILTAKFPQSAVFSDCSELVQPTPAIEHFNTIKDS